MQRRCVLFFVSLLILNSTISTCRFQQDRRLQQVITPTIITPIPQQEDMDKPDASVIAYTFVMPTRDPERQTDRRARPVTDETEYFCIKCCCCSYCECCYDASQITTEYTHECLYCTRQSCSHIGREFCSCIAPMIECTTHIIRDVVDCLCCIFYCCNNDD